MDLSVFLILLFVTLQFVAEYRNWSQYRVKLVIFIATLVLTLPKIIFMVIDWWQSPHSKIALLVLNTFKPILRGETYRLFRWLKSVGMGLTYDELNYLPISIPKNSTDFFMTRHCYDQASNLVFIKNISEDYDPDAKFSFVDHTICSFMDYTSCTGFVIHYESGTVFIHQLKFSRKLRDLWDKTWDEEPETCYERFVSYPLFKSRLIRSQTYTNVDNSRAQKLANRLFKICGTELPILENFECRREWYYFQAASTLDYLNGDLVLIQAKGENIAVG